MLPSASLAFVLYVLNNLVLCPEWVVGIGSRRVACNFRPWPAHCGLFRGVAAWNRVSGIMSVTCVVELRLESTVLRLVSAELRPDTAF